MFLWGPQVSRDHALYELAFRESAIRSLFAYRRRLTYHAPSLQRFNDWMLDVGRWVF
jgi:hypothetical protein